MNDLVIYNVSVSAAQYAFSNPINRASWPYAAAYFKFMYGTTRPTLKQLLRFEDRARRREQFTFAVDKMIESQGRKVIPPLSTSDLMSFFPYVIHRERQRDKHRSQLDIAVSMRISLKHRARRELELEEKLNQLVESTRVEDLPDVIYDIEASEGVPTARVFLMQFFNKHNKTKYSYSELYPRELNWQPWQIASSIIKDIF